MSAFWCERAWLGGLRADTGVLVETEGEAIASVQTAVAAPPPQAERLAGLVVPGLANAHSHAFQRALRGRTHRTRGSFWTWREQMYELAGRLDPDRLRTLARGAFGEMALAGITVVGEFHYVHHTPSGSPYEEPNAMGLALIEAAREAGVRITLLDTLYLHSGIGAEPEPGQRRFCDPDADAWAARVDRLQDSAHARIGAAVHSVRAVDPPAIARAAEWARAGGAPLHAHVSEQAAENEACRSAYGITPMQLLAREGAVSPRFTAVHATHVGEADVRTLTEAGACCCLCPTTERDLADGIGPARALRDGGVVLATGSDSHALIEPLEEARALELDERLGSGVRGGLTGDELLYAATAGGYASVGWPEGGMIRAGALADLTVIDTATPRLAGSPDDTLIDAAVFAATAADVRDVIVGGRFVVRDRRHLSLDVVRELEQAIAAVTT